MTKRALRRHHLARLKVRARRIFPDDPDSHTLVNHMKFCRHWFCRNPRRDGRNPPPTLQEERARLNWPEEWWNSKCTTNDENP